MKKNTLTFGAKINCAFAALAALLALTVWFGFHTTGSLQELLENSSGKTARKIELAGALNTAESDMAVGQLAVVLFTYAKDPAQAAGSKHIFRENAETFRKALAEIHPLVITDEGKQLLAHMEAGFALWLTAYTELEQMADAGNPEGAAKVLAEKTKPQWLALGEDCTKLTAIQNTQISEDRKSAGDQAASTRWILLLLVVFGIAVTAVALGTVRRANSTLRQSATELQEGSRQVAAAAGQVASASQSLAQGTSEQAATLEETSSSTTELTAITRRNAENTRSVSGLMTEAAQFVAGANRNLEEMVQSMKEINTSSEKISKIIRVIEEIAFQTNILALNAAVEAARAGARFTKADENMHLFARGAAQQQATSKHVRAPGDRLDDETVFLFDGAIAVNSDGHQVAAQTLKRVRKRDRGIGQVMRNAELTKASVHPADDGAVLVDAAAEVVSSTDLCKDICRGARLAVRVQRASPILGAHRHEIAERHQAAGFP